jgi:hypothetical protein
MAETGVVRGFEGEERERSDSKKYRTSHDPRSDGGHPFPDGLYSRKTRSGFQECSLAALFLASAELRPAPPWAARYASVRAARKFLQIGRVKQRQKLPKTAANSPFASLIK